MSNVPKVQIAAVVRAHAEEIEITKEHPVTQQKDLKPGECLVKLEATGVCHTDLHARLDDWPLHPKTPLVGGHEGVGHIVAIGDHTSQSPVKIGDRCEFCRKGLEQNCPAARLSGFTVDGTFQQYVVSYVNHVTPIPDGYDSFEAASILCAGVTVYRAIKYSETEHGDWIVLPGAGGGLGHLAVQYARARGLRVIAIDTGAEKKELCLKLGAEKWIDFRECKDIVKEIKGITGDLGAHAALVTAATGAAYQQAVDYLRSGGSLMAVGLPGEAKLEASIFFTVFKVRCIIAF
ncbi:GroES-like protein [Auriculariales sp. MPI-PUGE-AT-0066]|nr:GroES-like protein [Auriculariales sp. MPI-PUGE-AT-0066]